jgi:hypothetical protein
VYYDLTQLAVFVQQLMEFGIGTNAATVIILVDQMFVDCNPIVHFTVLVLGHAILSPGEYDSHTSSM